MIKRGVSHIEVILSFIIFVSAVGFALYFFSPLDGSRLVDSSLDYSFREISKNTSVELEVYNVKINGNIPQSASIITVSIPEVLGNTLVADNEGKKLSSRREGDLVYIENNDWENVKFISIKFSKDFKTDSVSDAALDESYYDISSSSSKNLISEKRISGLAGNYEKNYSDLKKSFNLPNRVDFGFSLVFSDDDSIVAERKIPESVEIFRDSRRIEVLRENGKIQFAELEVEIW